MFFMGDSLSAIFVLANAFIHRSFNLLLSLSCSTLTYNVLLPILAPKILSSSRIIVAHTTRQDAWEIGPSEGILESISGIDRPSCFSCPSLTSDKGLLTSSCYGFFSPHIFVGVLIFFVGEAGNCYSHFQLTWARTKSQQKEEPEAVMNDYYFIFITSWSSTIFVALSWFMCRKKLQGTPRGARVKAKRS